MTAASNEVVAVIQADREFAAEYNRMLSRVTRRDANAIREGGWDDTHEVQEIARHRIAHSDPRPVAEGMREAVCRILAKMCGGDPDEVVTVGNAIGEPCEVLLWTQFHPEGDKIVALFATHSPAPMAGEGSRTFNGIPISGLAAGGQYHPGDDA